MKAKRVSGRRFSGFSSAAGVCLAAVVLLFTAQNVGAQAFSTEEIDAFHERLKVTPAQKLSMMPVMLMSMKARDEVYKKYGVDLESGKKPSLLDLPGLGSEMTKVGTWTRERLEKILTPEQLAEYDKIVEEQTEIVLKALMP
ncbi:MAG: hypothetical protein MI861_26010 [Pirellulales bacterium]|nr:hypothetical protein [Pirellulales bacterium]